ncbi:MAG TPA: endolytic transglycosylase MltG [Cytophagaceae bacterium]|nr:endolytic transglycosylase MltG [Cytophagaceae bacterium]
MKARKPKPKKAPTSKKRPKLGNDKKFVLFLSALFILFILYHTFLGSNVNIRSEKFWIYIPAYSNTNKISEILADKEVINNSLTFKLMAYFMDFNKLEEHGLYEIGKNWNNYQLIAYLRVAKPIPAVGINIPFFRHRGSLSAYIGKRLKINTLEINKLINDTVFLKKFKGLDPHNAYCIFIPGSYYISKNPSAKVVFERMYSEYLHFWNEDRLEKAEDMGLSPEDVYILSSIVYCETKNYEEMPLVAGVYLNRLKKNMKLESDPTALFASNKTSARRVYNKHTAVKSPYNTYLNKGLPPGPICLPPAQVVDAVLDYDDHDFIYFCAKEDSSGTHNFAASYEEHKINAENYRKYLNKKRIF